MLNSHFGKFFSGEIAGGVGQARSSTVMGLTCGTVALACRAMVLGRGQRRLTARVREHGVALMARRCMKVRRAAGGHEGHGGAATASKGTGGGEHVSAADADGAA